MRWCRFAVLHRAFHNKPMLLALFQTPHKLALSLIIQQTDKIVIFLQFPNQRK